MGVFQNNLMGAAAAAASAGGSGFYSHQIANSLRNSASQDGTLKRTAGTPTSADTFTMSYWVKRYDNSTDGGANNIFVTGTGGGSYIIIGFKNNNFQAEFTGGTYGDTRLITNAVYRDTSAYYHHVLRFDSTQASASNRLRLYVNGVEPSYSSATVQSAISQDEDWDFINESGVVQAFGGLSGKGHGTEGANLQMAEIVFCDGQSYGPDSFGETKNGVWIPKDPSGLTFGNNGYYLNFASSSDLGNDVSGNNNDFTPANLSAHDQMLDSPTNNFPTFNPLTFNAAAELPSTEGNCMVKGADAIAKSGNPEQGQLCTMGVRSGKWYWEVKLSGGGATTSDRGWSIGISSTSDINLSMVPSGGPRAGRYDNGYAYSGYSGTGIYHDNSITSYGSAPANNDIIGVALDLSSQGSGSLTFYKNGSSLGVAVNGSIADAQWIPFVGLQGGNPSGYNATVNFGQDGTFAGLETAQGNSDENGHGNFYYSVPSGFLAMCTANLPVADAIDPAQTDDDFPSKLFEALTYTGTGSSGSITTKFQPDFIWMKNRGTSKRHYVVDSNRGINSTSPYLHTDQTVSEGTGNSTGVSGVSSTSISFGGGLDYVNASSNTYVAWNWRANGGTTSTNSSGSINVTQQVDPSGGFSISTYSGTAGTPTIGHGLSSAPTFVIVKQTNGTHNWAVYAAGAGATKYGFLESTSGFGTDNMWGNTTPSSTLVYLGVYTQTSGSGRNYVAYCFADTEGYIKSGSYVGNGDGSDGTFVYTGFKPAWVMVKKLTSTNNWRIEDNARDPYNPAYHMLLPNSSAAEDAYTDGTDYNDFLSNGFKLARGGDAANWNASGSTYVYLAMAENPFKYATAR